MIKKCNLSWDIIQSKYLYTSKWLTVRKDWVRTPKGIDIEDFYVLEYPTWINVIARTKEGTYLIEQQYRHGIQQTLFELCAGTCEEGEKPIDAAKRELKEETGYSGGQWKLIGKFAPNPNSMSNWCYSFFADGVTKQDEPQQEPTEDITTYEVTKDELLEMMRSGSIVEGIMLAPLWQHFYEETNK